MLETVVLVIFAIALAVGIAAKIPLYVTLAFGFVLFSVYGLIKGHSLKEVLLMAKQGLTSIGPIMILFVIIGMLTAAWRASGTVAAITCYSATLISPSSLVVISFILCAVMSFVTGSSYAAAATVGVICMTIASAMGAQIAIVAGAVISGSFFGDRSSPLSATVNLVSSLTNTPVFYNVDRLIRTGVVPIVLTAILYVIAGSFMPSQGYTPNFEAMFAPSFNLSLLTLLPTLVIAVLSIRRVSVNKTMCASLTLALVLCVALQKTSIAKLPGILFFGYKTANQSIAHMVDGGGILSMVPIALIVTVASTFSGLFEGTGLLNNLRLRIKKLARSATPFAGVLATSLLTTAIACDQILSIMLTKQLCDELEYGGEALALDLCNSASMAAGFIPWSTVCVGILAFLEAPPVSCLFAFFTYLTPLWLLALSLYQRSHPEFVKCPVGRALGLEEHDDIRNKENYDEL